MDASLNPGRKKNKNKNRTRKKNVAADSFSLCTHVHRKKERKNSFFLGQHAERHHGQSEIQVRKRKTEKKEERQKIGTTRFISAEKNFLSVQN